MCASVLPFNKTTLLLNICTTVMYIWILVSGLLYSTESRHVDCKWTRTIQDVIVNCSGRRLTWIPSLNDSVTYLDLSHNEIADISHSSLPKGLKHLDFSWNKIKQLERTTFLSLSQLHYLDLSYCKLRDVDKGVFGELYNLQFLNISFNRELGFASLPNITFNLNQTKIASLYLNGINCATGIGTIMKRSHLKNIQMTNLTKLSIASNRLELFEPGVLSNLPKTLQIFSTAQNKLTAGAYLLEFPSMPEIKVYDMSFQLHPPKYPESVVNQCEEKMDENVKSKDFVMRYIKFQFNWTIPLPPKLETLYAQSSRLYIKDPTFSIYAPNLRHVYFQNNFILSLENYIQVRSNRIETIDFSNNFCSRMFQTNDGHHVKHLNLSHNDLSQDFEEDTVGDFFRTFTSLEMLDISFNQINSLPKYFLKNSNNLMYINASNNRLSSWIVDIDSMYNLTYLDLFENKLTTLSVNTRVQFERAFQRSNFTINLSENGLACTCENLDFLLWIQKNRKHFRNIEKYSCNTKVVTFQFKALDSSIKGLQEHCTSYLGWYIGSATLLAVFFSCIMGFVLVRNKWKIRYMLYQTKQRLGLKPHYKPISTSVYYEHDAFVSYSRQELRFILEQVLPRLEAENHLNLCIKDRNHELGRPKVDNIMTSIQESRHTICIVSKRYLESKWRDYELNMAKVEGIKDRESLNYVILVLLPEVYKGGYPQKIMDLINQECYIEYPEESCAYGEFWDRLARRIKG